MAILDLPAAMRPQVANFGLQKVGVQFKGAFNGNLQAANFVAERWGFSLTVPPKSLPESGRVEAFLNLLSGGVNYVGMHHPARFVPAGTLRGSPVLGVAALRGAQQLTLSNCTPGATLEPGDMLGIDVATQLFQVALDCTADGDGTMVVPLVNRVRATCSPATAVTWLRPTALFCCPSMRNDLTFQTNSMSGAALDLIETWDPLDESTSTGLPPGTLMLGDGFLHFDVDGNLILT